MRAKFPCRRCGRAVEPAREVYAEPTCYRCLPPPTPLPRVFTEPQPIQVRPLEARQGSGAPLVPCVVCGSIATRAVERFAVIRRRGEVRYTCTPHAKPVAVELAILAEPDEGV